MDAVRTADERFDDLPGYPFSPHYVDVPDGDPGQCPVPPSLDRLGARH